MTSPGGRPPLPVTSIPTAGDPGSCRSGWNGPAASPSGPGQPTPPGEPNQTSRTGTRSATPPTPPSSHRSASAARDAAHVTREHRHHHGDGCVVHLAHGHAEPVPEKPDPLTAGPGDQFFGPPHLLFGDVRAVHRAAPAVTHSSSTPAAASREWMAERMTVSIR